jgi:NAD(P)H-hydrate epimerase
VKIATAGEMAAVDRSAAERFGVPVALLMERAGQRVSEVAGILLGGLSGRRVILVCGRGNNGGDGLVAARHLRQAGAEPLVLLAGDPAGLPPDPRRAWEAAIGAGVECAVSADESALAAHGDRAREADLVVDALLGTGFSPPARGVVAAAIAFINGLGRPVLAVDLPSGLAADRAHVDGAAVRALATVTFGYPKTCLVVHPAAGSAGSLWVADLGFPAETDALVAGDLNLGTPAELARHLAPRDPQSHKGTFGHVLIIAGSRGMAGAAALSARGALRAGAGLVTAGLPATVAPPLLPGLPEAMLLPLPDEGRGSLGTSACAAVLERQASTDALALGPGLSRSRESAAFVRNVAAAATVPLVLDADALMALAESGAEPPRWRGGPPVLTPHPGEMARLLGVSTTAVQDDRVGAARACAARFKAVAVLKGARSVVAEAGGRAWINTTGNPAMAAPGVGDVLTGVIAAHLARGLSPLDAALLGVHLHGSAGDLWAAANGPWGLLASEVADRIPEATRRCREDRGNRPSPHLSLLVP